MIDFDAVIEAGGTFMFRTEGDLDDYKAWLLRQVCKHCGARYADKTGDAWWLTERDCGCKNRQLKTGDKMTDLELTRLCAEAMGYLEYMPKKWWTDDDRSHFHIADNLGGLPFIYDPLHNDTQAMALVRTMRLTVFSEHPNGGHFDDQHGNPKEDWWQVNEHTGYISGGNGATASGTELNRAICECVAKMQKGKS